MVVSVLFTIVAISLLVIIPIIIFRIIVFLIKPALFITLGIFIGSGLTSPEVAAHLDDIPKLLAYLPDAVVLEGDYVNDEDSKDEVQKRQTEYSLNRKLDSLIEHSIALVQSGAELRRLAYREE